jgi:NADH-quinone oxidoreductase subunit L
MHRLTHARSHHADGDDEHGQATGDDEHKPARLDPRLAPDPTDPQDLRNMGGLGALMPRTRTTYLIACWAIAGFPWAAGFFSKDEILARAFARSPWLWAAGLLTALCTAFYAFRTYYLAFASRAPSAEQRAHVVESPGSMTTVLLVLAALCLIVGPALGLPMLWTGHEPVMAGWLAPVVAGVEVHGADVAHEASRATEWVLMLASLLAAAVGWIGARALYGDIAARGPGLETLRARFGRIHAFVFDQYRVDELYQRLFVRGFARVAWVAALFDIHIVDGVVVTTGAITRGLARVAGVLDAQVVDGAVNAVAEGMLSSGRALRRLQTGRVNNYVLGVAVGIVILIVLTSWL